MTVDILLEIERDLFRLADDDDCDDDFARLLNDMARKVGAEAERIKLVAVKEAHS